MTALAVALSAMGYREVQEGRWAKPIGYHLFTFEMSTRKWTNWFIDSRHVTSVWTSRVLCEDTLSDIRRALLDIKECEAYTRIGIDASRRSSFELVPDPFYWINDPPKRVEHGAPGTGQVCGAANDCTRMKGHAGEHENLYTGRKW